MAINLFVSIVFILCINSISSNNDTTTSPTNTTSNANINESLFVIISVIILFVICFIATILGYKIYKYIQRLENADHSFHFTKYRHRSTTLDTRKSKSNINRNDINSISTPSTLNTQIQNDAVIAQQIQSNYNDIQMITNGNVSLAEMDGNNTLHNIKPQQNYSNNSNNNNNMDINIQIQNDKIIAQNWQKNQIDLIQITNGNIKMGEIHKTLPNNGEIKDNDISIQIKNDELIAKHYQKNQIDLQNVTNGDVLYGELQKKKSTNNDDLNVGEALYQTTKHNI